MLHMTERTNIRLDQQAKEDAKAIMSRYNLRSVSAAVRFALREIARDSATGSPIGTTQPDQGSTGEEDRGD